MNAILYDKPAIANTVNMKAIGLVDALKAYDEIDSGAVKSLQLTCMAS